jgi:hypothetical protein
VSRLLFESEHVRIEVDSDRRIVWFRRNGRPHGTLDEAALMFTDAERATAAIDRARYGLLIDLREAIGRNEPAFEQAISAPRAAFLSKFGRRAALVRTVAGKLQEQRLSRESANEMAVFQDEAEAMRHLGVLNDQRR